MVFVFSIGNKINSQSLKGNLYVNKLTRIENNFAEHYPLVGEKQPDFNVLGQLVLQMDRDISGIFQYSVGHVAV